ncbi:MAG: serine O-acetyltransferase [Clostridia bacterium]|nr:serine O-acetyltransferase [Clostridia bacterium]
MPSYKKLDLQAAFDRDPAAKNKLMIRLTYTGYKAICAYRRAHWYYTHNLKYTALFVSYIAKRRFGIDIHPAAQIGHGFFIDHGIGTVIGETTIIGDNVTLYQQVTLGGTGKDVGKRHPTIGNNVMISAGAKILGPVTVGDHSKIGAGSVLLKDVPPYSTVVGVPGRIVRMNGEKYVDELDQKLPDPIIDELNKQTNKIKELEEKIKELEKKIGDKDDA